MAVLQEYVRTMEGKGSYMSFMEESKEVWEETSTEEETPTQAEIKQEEALTFPRVYQIDSINEFFE